MGHNFEPMEAVLVFAKDSVFLASFIQHFHDHTNDTCKWWHLNLNVWAEA